MSRPSPATSARSPPRSATISTPRSTATARAAGPAPSRSPAIRRCRPAARRSPTMSRRPPALRRRLAPDRGRRDATTAPRSRSASAWSPATAGCAAGTAIVATGLGAAAAERLIRVNRLAEIETALARRRRRGRSRPSAPPPRRSPACRPRATPPMPARRAEAEAGAAIREAGRAEDSAAVEIERLELRRTGLAERAAQAEAGPRRRAARRSPRPSGSPPPCPTPPRPRRSVAELRAAAERAQAGARRGPRRGRDPRPRGQRRQAARRGGAQGAGRLAGPRRRGRQAPRRIRPPHRRGRGRGASGSPTRPDELDAPDRGADRRSRPPPPRPPRPPPPHERAGEEALRATEARLAEAGEALATAREARAGAAARAEAQEARRDRDGAASRARSSNARRRCCPRRPASRRTTIAAGRDRIRPPRAADSAERERIGPVNLVAERELTELEESRLASQAEREELGLAINRLRGSIGSLNREGRARLLAAFEDGRPPFPQPVHHPVRRRPGASRAGRIGRSARGRARDHGPAARQAPLDPHPALGRRAGADRDRPDLRPVPHQSRPRSASSTRSTRRSTTPISSASATCSTG